MGTETTGMLKVVEVASDTATPNFEPMCVFEEEVIISFGKYGTEKEYCNSKKEPFVNVKDLEFEPITLTYEWVEGTGSEANEVIKTAHSAETAEGKTIAIRGEARNADGVVLTKGTLYTANYMVTEYKYTFTKGKVNKAVFTAEQLTVPVETEAA